MNLDLRKIIFFALALLLMFQVVNANITANNEYDTSNIHNVMETSYDFVYSKTFDADTHFSVKFWDTEVHFEEFVSKTKAKLIIDNEKKYLFNHSLKYIKNLNNYGDIYCKVEKNNDKITLTLYFVQNYLHRGSKKYLFVKTPVDNVIMEDIDNGLIIKYNKKEMSGNEYYNYIKNHKVKHYINYSLRSNKADYTIYFYKNIITNDNLALIYEYPKNSDNHYYYAVQFKNDFKFATLYSDITFKDSEIIVSEANRDLKEVTFNIKGNFCGMEYSPIYAYLYLTSIPEIDNVLERYVYLKDIENGVKKAYFFKGKYTLKSQIDPYNEFKKTIEIYSDTTIDLTDLRPYFRCNNPKNLNITINNLPNDKVKVEFKFKTKDRPYYTFYFNFYTNGSTFTKTFKLPADYYDLTINYYYDGYTSVSDSFNLDEDMEKIYSYNGTYFKKVYERKIINIPDDYTNTNNSTKSSKDSSSNYKYIEEKIREIEQKQAELEKMINELKKMLNYTSIDNVDIGTGGVKTPIKKTYKNVQVEKSIDTSKINKAETKEGNYSTATSNELEISNTLEISNNEQNDNELYITPDEIKIINSSKVYYNGKEIACNGCKFVIKENVLYASKDDKVVPLEKDSFKDNTKYELDPVYDGFKVEKVIEKSKFFGLFKTESKHFVKTLTVTK